MGRQPKLSERGMRLFKKYVLRNRLESLHVIVSRFNVTTALKLIESTGKGYMKKLHLNCFFEVRKPFLSKKNFSVRVTWACTHQYLTKKIDASNVHRRVIAFCSSHENRIHVW